MSAPGVVTSAPYPANAPLPAFRIEVKLPVMYVPMCSTISGLGRSSVSVRVSNVDGYSLVTIFVEPTSIDEIRQLENFDDNHIPNPGSQLYHWASVVRATEILVTRTRGMVYKSVDDIARMEAIIAAQETRIASLEEQLRKCQSKPSDTERRRSD
jgi:hypothetical protein